MIERETWTTSNSYIRIEKWGGGPPDFFVYLESPLPPCRKGRQYNGFTPCIFLQTI